MQEHEAGARASKLVMFVPRDITMNKKGSKVPPCDGLTLGLRDRGVGGNAVLPLPPSPSPSSSLLFSDYLPTLMYLHYFTVSLPHLFGHIFSPELKLRRIGM